MTELPAIFANKIIKWIAFTNEILNLDNQLVSIKLFISCRLYSALYETSVIIIIFIIIIISCYNNKYYSYAFGISSTANVAYVWHTLYKLLILLNSIIVTAVHM